MKELWCPIKDYYGLYSVSNQGRVRRNDSKKIIKPNCSNGYASLTLSMNNVHKTKTVHRLVAEHFIPNPLNLKQVNHKNNIRNNNCVKNLKWGTHKSNSEDAVESGLYNRGNKHYLSKMTPEKVIAIRKEYIPWKVSSRDLAKKYNIAQGSVMQILKRKTWTHV